MHNCVFFYKIFPCGRGKQNVFRNMSYDEESFKALPVVLHLLMNDERRKLEAEKVFRFMFSQKKV